jgi:hypothetical protein
MGRGAPQPALKGRIRLTSRNKQHAQLLQKLQDMGHAISLTGGGHYRIDTENGPVFTGASPSDRRAWQRLRSDLRRKGVKV